VVCNRPKSAAYRAPGSPISAYAVESALDAIAARIGIDPLKFRLLNAARAGTPTAWGPKHAHDGYAATVQALLDHPAYAAPLGKNRGRGVASGYWFNNGGESSASVHVNDDGSVVVATGSMDIGGSRASMAIMAAETLGIEYDMVRATVADTGSIGYTHLTAGSRTTFATGIAVVDACRKVMAELCARAAMIWSVPKDEVIWEDGSARYVGPGTDKREPLPLKAIAAKRALTGGPIGAEASVNAGGVAPGFASELCEVEVDPETGSVKVLRFVVAQDVGRAIHRSYVEGQLEGGAVQGIGWALNEAYLYDDAGHLLNAGFLDYRVPVASDLPMIETVLIEVPNPNHPYGVKGVGEVNIVPSLAAVANAVSAAIGRRLTELPMSPPKVLAAIHSGREG
jgi:CO/xanthine dehydrogenase Mo-binding subunit